MRLVTRFLNWRKRRRLEAHIRWLRDARVTLSKPHHSCARPGTEAVP